ncbi:MAG TPA: hypothetical protein DCQ98_07560 [Planctomycetaceae bacterium]|nr:hypothetical protein [Planctomycetaceae bacterium]
MGTRRTTVRASERRRAADRQAVLTRATRSIRAIERRLPEGSVRPFRSAMVERESICGAARNFLR